MSFEFIADRPALDFVPTVAERGTTHRERLRTEQDLAQWVAESRLLDRAPEVTARELAHARAVREAIFGLLAALIDDTPARPADRELVNAAAARPGPVLSLGPDGRLHRDGDVDAVLAVLARDCLDLFASPDRALLHWCADDACTRPFVDRSRGARRRWCGMKGCGDRAKAVAYRRRRRSSGDQRP